MGTEHGADEAREDKDNAEEVDDNIETEEEEDNNENDLGVCDAAPAE